MNEPKILVAIPWHPVKNYCRDRLFEAVENLAYPNKEVVMRWDPSEYGSQDAVKKQREFMRTLAINGGFDYLYFLGADTIPPSDVLNRLVAQASQPNVKIVGGVYWGRSNAQNGRPDAAVAWIHNLSQADQTKLFLEPNRLISVDGMGMDCVLIAREVFEKISWLSWPQNDDDYPFYDRAIELGYQVWLDTSVQCKHYWAPKQYVQFAKHFID